MKCDNEHSFQASLLMLDVKLEPSPVISQLECTASIAEQSEVCHVVLFEAVPVLLDRM